MLEKLISLVADGWSALRPFFVVPVWETGAVLRFGRFHRAAPPGFHWKIPLVEDVSEITTIQTTLRLPTQQLTTKDDQQVSLTTIVRYEIVDVEKYTTGIFDQNDVLADVTMGAVRRLTAAATYRELVDNPPEGDVLKAVRDKVNRYGFRIHEVTFVSFTRAKPIALITQSVLKDLAN